MQNKILFVVNPVSGGKTKESIPQVIKHYFKNQEIDIIFTNKSGDATEIVKKGIIDGFTTFVAVGGDGTVNEIAKALINTNFVLGILPFGSGNGLARHNKIPMDLHEAILTLKSNFYIKIDTCSLNQNPFINMAGVGFDAHIGQLFGKDKKRGFKSYVKTTIQEFKNYIPQQYTIKVNGKTYTEKAFLVSFANSSQYGNNAYISPKADISDGKINVTLLKPFGFWGLFDIVSRLFLKTIHLSNYVITFESSKEIEIERNNTGVYHLDGEPYWGFDKIKIGIVPLSLNLIVPEEVYKKNSKYTTSKNILDCQATSQICR